MSPGDTPVLVDTSVAVAVVVADHEHHEAASASVASRLLGLAGHAWFETYSVLTRLPAPIRRAPAEVTRILEHDFPATSFLSESSTRALGARMASLGIAGGAVYDALIGATALEHGRRLLSRDRRAIDVYRVLGVDCELIAQIG